MKRLYQLLKKEKTRSATVHQSIKSLRESEEFSEIIERLSMTFTANGHVTNFSRRFLRLPFALCRSQREGRWFHVDEKRE